MTAQIDFAVPGVPGLRYIPNYASEDCQKALQHFIEAQTHWTFDSGAYSRFHQPETRKSPLPPRRKLCFGGMYDPTSRTIAEKIGPLPEILSPVAVDLVAQNFMSELPDQAIVNEYLPGQGIDTHADAKCFLDDIAALTIGSGCTMIFRRKAIGARVDLYLEPGSLLVMTGEARWKWTHEIPRRKSDSVNGARIPRGTRYSITFRIMARAASAS
jgi:alkylated DNA repair dioxygenase AlkB